MQEGQVDCGKLFHLLPKQNIEETKTLKHGADPEWREQTERVPQARLWFSLNAT
jgi:hypothetical protein